MRRRASTATMFQGKYQQKVFEGSSASSTGELLKSHERASSPQAAPSWRQRMRTKPRLICTICVAVVLVVLALGLGLGLGLRHRRTSSAVVNLGYSKYRGQAVGGGVSQWLGIRYAAPPLGNLRFAAPQSPLPNDTIQEANQVRRKNPNGNATSADMVIIAWPSMPRNPRVGGQQ